MFDIGLQEMLVIGVLALLVFGPSKLPELGRMVGRAMREFRRASEEFRSTVETNLNMNDLDPPPVADVAAPTPVDATPTSALPSELESAATQSVATETAVEEHGEAFVAQRGARLFHRRECAWVRRIAEVERVYFKQVAEARDQGFVTCPVCEPWEPA
jgi:Tat protein translocase TatB subunit